MKRILLPSLLLLAALGSHAQLATNELAVSLQTGLFEEEANHNVSAAIQAYEAVVTRFDKDRKLAATAVFRLAECYRKLGRTNEAVAQYQRVTREFSDQVAVLDLSRENLAKLVPAQSSGPAAAESASPLTSAEAEEVKRIQAMIRDSPDLINARDNSGETPLLRAIGQAQMRVVTFLLDHGAEIDLANRRGATPLIRAAEAGHKGIVELLISRKANVNAADNSGNTALHAAAANGFKSVAEVLIANGASVNPTTRAVSPLYAAVVNDRRTVAETLLAAKADVNAASPTGYTPLHAAAEAGNEAMVSLLLSKGARANVTDTQNATPLFVAASRGRTGAVKLLLENKADPNIPTRENRQPSPGPQPTSVETVVTTPLFAAVNGQFEDIVSLLLANGSDPNILSGIPRATPLFLAVRLGKESLVKLLLEAHADVNLGNSEGLTPLHCSLGRKTLFTPLLEAKANVNATNSAGEAPLHFAAGADLAEAAEALLARGADIEARDKQGFTPLFCAVIASAAGRSQETVRLLLDHKANPNVVDKSNRTPLDWLNQRLSYSYSQEGPGLQVVHAYSQQSLPMPPGMVAANPTPAAVSVLLKQSGALADLPRPDQIVVRRKSTGFSFTAFKRGTNDFNTFTLLDALAVAFDFVAAAPQGDGGRSRFAMSTFAAAHAGWKFPDFSRIVCRRLEEEQGKWTDRPIDLSPLFGTGDCALNTLLKWGDVIELPEADHVLNEPWAGFSEAELNSFVRCLKRTVFVVVKGKTNSLELLAPQLEKSAQIGLPQLLLDKPFWIAPALKESNLLLASSDLVNVRVKRVNRVTGGTIEWLLDCSPEAPAPQLWLLDGDVIEVPEKNAGAAGTVKF